jgi:hypothetical protein
VALPDVLDLVQIATAGDGEDRMAREADRRHPRGVGRGREDVRPRAAGADDEAAGQGTLTRLSRLALLCAGLLAGCGSSDSGEPSTDGGSANDAAAAADGRARRDSGGAADASRDAMENAEVGPGAEAGEGGEGGDAAGSPGDAAGLSDGDADTDGAFVAATHPPLPQLQNGGGAVLAHPKVVPLFFSDYDRSADVTAMLQGLPGVEMPDGGNTWAAAVSEYGVGPLTVLPPVMLAQTAPTTGAANPSSFISNQVDTNAALATVDTSTIVAVFYPSTTPLSGSCAAQSVGWGGYHDSVMTTKGRVPFAVVSECASFGSLTSTLDMVTVGASHEIMEAATDPFLSGWQSLDTSTPSGWAWNVLLGGNEEDGDMCALNAAFGRPGGAYPYLLQRGWSNRAAAAGNLDPCQPDVLPAQPYVGAYPVMPDPVSTPGSRGAGALIAQGSSKTIEVDCFSFQPTAPFTVGARQGRGVQPPQLTFAWDRTTCVNGDKLHLTLGVQSEGTSGVETFIVYAQLAGASDPQMPAWPGVVAQQ